MVDDTQKRYADDVTVQELVRLRVENERLREALQHMVRWHDQLSANDIAKADAALQQKDSE